MRKIKEDLKQAANEMNSSIKKAMENRFNNIREIEDFKVKNVNMSNFREEEDDTFTAEYNIQTSYTDKSSFPYEDKFIISVWAQGEDSIGKIGIETENGFVDKELRTGKNDIKSALESFSDSELYSLCNSYNTLEKENLSRKGWNEGLNKKDFIESVAKNMKEKANTESIKEANLKKGDVVSYKNFRGEIDNISGDGEIADVNWIGKGPSIGPSIPVDKLKKESYK